MNSGYWERNVHPIVDFMSAAGFAMVETAVGCLDAQGTSPGNELPNELVVETDSRVAAQERRANSEYKKQVGAEINYGKRLMRLFNFGTLLLQCCIFHFNTHNR